MTQQIIRGEIWKMKDNIGLWGVHELRGVKDEKWNTGLWGVSKVLAVKNEKWNMTLVSEAYVYVR